MGGIRQQFGSAVCVQMVQHSVRAVARVRRADAHAGAHAAGVVPPARLSVPGRRRHARRRSTARADAQAAAGAVQRRLSVDEIAALVPGLALDDIRWGLFGPEDGYANPREVLFGLRAAAMRRRRRVRARRGRRRRGRGRACDRRAAGAVPAGSTRRWWSTPPARCRAASPRWPGCACRSSRCASCSSAARCPTTGRRASRW